MSSKSYSEKLRDPRWQKKRLEILQRDHFACCCCEDAKTELHIHHQEYHGEPWEADSGDLFTVCKHCHIILEQIGRKYHIGCVEIRKLAGWNGGSKLMIVRYDDECDLVVFDKLDNQVCNLGLDPSDREEIIMSLRLSMGFPEKVDPAENPDDLTF